MSKSSKADSPQMTIMISGLNEPLRTFRGQPLMSRDGETEPVPLTLGDALLNLLGMYGLQDEQPNMRGKTAMLIGRVGDRLVEAMEAGKDYEAGEAAVGVLRKVARANCGAYVAQVMASVWRALGEEEGEP